jgi:hypothetical protein
LSDLRAHSDSFGRTGASVRRATVCRRSIPRAIVGRVGQLSPRRPARSSVESNCECGNEARRRSDESAPGRALDGFPSDSGPPLPGALKLAKALDAEEIVVGSIERTEAGVKITASLIDAIHGRVEVERVAVRGQPDSLTTVVDRIIAGLILSESDPDAGAIEPPSVSPAALRVYLTGRAAYRQGDYDAAVRNFNQSLIEEPRFALAALGLSLAADKLNAADQRDRGLSIAWSRQERVADDRSDVSPGARRAALSGPVLGVGSVDGVGEGRAIGAGSPGGMARARRTILLRR